MDTVPREITLTDVSVAFLLAATLKGKKLLKGGREGCIFLLWVDILAPRKQINSSMSCLPLKRENDDRNDSLGYIQSP